MNFTSSTDPSEPGARKKSFIPDIDSVPAAALITRAQLAALTGFTEQAFKKWAREGRGPRVTTVESRPRYSVADVREWLSGSARAA